LWLASAGYVQADQLVVAPQVEQWGIEEVVLHSSRSYENPFTEVQVQAQFSTGSKQVHVDGFYDSNHTWKIRLMPETQGHWTFRTTSTDAALNGQVGEFDVGPPAGDNHGPVSVAKTYHFSYADGTPYFLLGTTLYNWLNRDRALEERTLSTLAKSPFTKVRFGLFPLWYVFNRVDPPDYPYVEISKHRFDFDRFDPKFFVHVESRLRDLQKLGIVADIILFLPYDNWGFASMDAARDDAYVRYVVARLAAYQNVWWTMANEYNFWDPRVPKEWNGSGAQNRLPQKNWDHLFQVLEAADPYNHERGIHNCGPWYDHAKPWITHVVAQEDLQLTRLTLKARRTYGKPVVIDEYGYEGNMFGGGPADLSPTEELSRHWEITLAGGYATEGEAYVHPDGIQWWSVGGELVGGTAARLGFLKKIMTEGPFQNLMPSPERVMDGTALAKPGEYYLFRFTSLEARLPPQIKTDGAAPYKVDLIDPWLMKVYPLGYTAAGTQAFVPLFAPALLRFTKTGPPDRDLPTGSLTELLAKFAGDTTHLEAPKIRPFKVETEYFSIDYKLGELLSDSRARSLLLKYIPSSTKLAAEMPIVLGFPLAYLPYFAGDRFRDISAAQLSAVSPELASIPVK